MAEVVTRNSTNSIEVLGLYDREEEEYIDNASIDCDFLDASLVAISGGQNIVLTKVDGTSGSRTKYRGSLNSAPAGLVAAGATCWLRITAQNPDTLAVREFMVECVAQDG